MFDEFLIRIRLTLPYPLGVVFLALLMFGQASSTVVAQDRHWDGPIDGNWNEAFKWTGSDVPDLISETANINTGGTYEVTYNSNYSIGGLTLGATGASLTMFGIGGQHTSLELASDLFVFGTINLDCNQDGIDTTLICNGTITNMASGKINFGGTSLNGASDRNLRADLFINDGNVNVNQNGRFDKTNGVLTNNNVFNVAIGKSFTFGTNNTLNQNAGTFFNQGTVSMTGGTVNLNGGNFTGNAIDLRDSTLTLVGTGSGEFNLTGTTIFSGNVVNGQQINLIAESVIHQMTTVTADFNNFGVINLDSNADGIDVTMTRAGTIGNSIGGTINFGGTSLNNATDRRLQADLFVNDGVVNINRYANFDQTNGVYTNNNEINIAAGSRLQFGTNNTFNQNGGTFDNQGNLTFSGDTLNFNGGNFTGNAVNIASSTLNNNATGAGVFNLTGAVDYTGDLVAGQFLNLSTVGITSQTTTLGADFTNFSTINIDSNGDGIDVAMIRSGSITNAATGTINFGGTSLNNATDRRLQADLFVNDGVVNINRYANFDQTNGVYTNNNEINIAAGSRLQFGTNNTFNQNGGTFDNQGNLTFSGDTLNFNGGNFTGNAVNIASSTLNNNATGAGVFNLTGAVDYTGDLVAGQFLNLSTVGITSQTTTLGADFTNFSTINIDSNGDGIDVAMIRSGSITNAATGTINFGGTSLNNATDRRLQADLFVNDGVVNINRYANFDQTNGVYTNNNEINIAAGSRLQFGTNNTFNQNGGTFDNQGNLTFSGDTLNFNGGNFTGNAVNIASSTLNNNATGAGVFNLTGAVDYTGDLVAGQFLNLSTVGITSQTTTLGADFTNFSTINIDSNGDGIDVAMIRSGSITNAATGTINFGGTSLNNATDRRLQADLFVNDGVVNINRYANFDQTNGVYTNNNEINIAAGSRLQFGTNNTFNQNGGTFDNQGNLTFSGDTLNFNGGNFTGNAVNLAGSALNIGVGSIGNGDFLLTGTNTFSGDLAADQSMHLLVGSNVVATTTAVADFINSGTITLTSNSDGIDVHLVRDGLITNSSSGTIAFAGTSINAATDRVLDAELHNAGIVEIILPNIRAQIGSNSTTHAMDHLNSGTILNQASTLRILGDSFTNEATGLLAGNGVFDFADTGILNEGTIAPGFSAGQMEFLGFTEFTSTADLQIELGGTLSSEYDWISFSDGLLLDGSLSVSFIDDFQNSILSTDSFTIIDSVSTSGMFAGLVDGTRFSTTDNLGSFQISYVGNNVVLGNFQSSVPEPGNLILLAGLALGCLVRRRRTRS